MEANRPGCGCGAICTQDAEVSVYPSLAMMYPPIQQFRLLYDSSAALSRGTIFRELDKPFTARAVQCSGMPMRSGIVR